MFYDLAAQQPSTPKAYLGRDGKNTYHVKRTLLGRAVVRDPKTVTGVTLHQTACRFDVTKANVIRHGGEAQARRRRALDVAAHMTCFQQGDAVLAYPMLWYVYHGNTLNASTFGLELEGLFDGDSYEPRGFDKLIEAGREGLKVLVDEGRKLGCPIEFLYAHRQVSSSRRADPGAMLWREVGIEYGVKVLKLKVNNDFARDGGRPIPHVWDPTSNQPY